MRLQADLPATFLKRNSVSSDRQAVPGLGAGGVCPLLWSIDSTLVYMPMHTLWHVLHNWCWASCQLDWSGARHSSQAPFKAQLPVEATDEDAHHDGDHEGYGLVLRRAPVGDEVLVQDEAELGPETARVLLCEVQRLRALLGPAQLLHHPLHLPAAAC